MTNRTAILNYVKSMHPAIYQEAQDHTTHITIAYTTPDTHRFLKAYLSRYGTPSNTNERFLCVATALYRFAPATLKQNGRIPGDLLTTIQQFLSVKRVAIFHYKKYAQHHFKHVPSFRATLEERTQSLTSTF